MSTTFPLVEIPPSLLEAVGKPDKGTRIFRQYGSDHECTLWWEVLHEIDRSFVSPGGVGMFAGVSRAAVHKRLQDGTLTAFCFHTTEQTQNWFGWKKRKTEKRPWVYIPVKECRAWGEALKARANDRLTEEDEGDFEGRFLDLQKNVDERLLAEKEVSERWRKMKSRIKEREEAEEEEEKRESLRKAK